MHSSGWRHRKRTAERRDASEALEDLMEGAPLPSITIKTIPHLASAVERRCDAVAYYWLPGSRTEDARFLRKIPRIALTMAGFQDV